METKIVIDLTCVHCGSVIQIQKRKSQEQCKLVCPNQDCKKKLHVLFNTQTDPQTYSFIAIPQSETKEKSAEKVDSNEQKKEASEEEEQPKVPKNKTIYKKNKDKAHNYEGIPGEDEEEKPRKAKHKNIKLRETLFLTRKKFFGLVAERYRLSEGETIVGRVDDEEPSDISLSGDETISRRSISINIIPDEYGFDYILKVLNASNPVRLNGKPLRVGEKVYMDLGDVITIGHTELKFDNR